MELKKITLSWITWSRADQEDIENIKMSQLIIIFKNLLQIMKIFKNDRVS